MAKSRIVNTKFWVDTYISNIDPIEKLLFLYLITNPSTNISGIYELPVKNIALDTAIDKEMVIKIIDRFSADKKIFYIDGWVVIKNFVKNQNQESPMVLRGIARELALIPKEITSKLQTLSEGIDTLSHLTEPNLTKPNLTYTAKDRVLAELLLELIRQNTPTYREPNIDNWSDDIRKMRELDGRTEEQIEYLIRWCQQDSFWKANILSPNKLREKFDQLVAKIKSTKDTKKKGHLQL